jgi:acetyl-CoA carboxylase biotin carboxyl carrier protein
VKFDLDGMDLATLIDAIDRSGISEFSLVTADGELRVSKTPADGARLPAAVPATPPAAAVAETTTRREADAPAVEGADGSPAPPAAGGTEQLEIRAPLLGVFYRAPKPGEPAFVEIGDRVEPDTTVAIVEAMKVFTAVPAGVSGVITEVLVQDREFIEYDQAIFRVEPAAAAVAPPAPR